eukprot:1195447-Prorocentrum_minimum.AAC.3
MLVGACNASCGSHLRREYARQVGVEFCRVQIPRQREGGGVVQDAVEALVLKGSHQLRRVADELGNPAREEPLRPRVHAAHLRETILVIFEIEFSSGGVA